MDKSQTHEPREYPIPEGAKGNNIIDANDLFEQRRLHNETDTARRRGRAIVGLTVGIPTVILSVSQAVGACNRMTTPDGHFPDRPAACYVIADGHNPRLDDLSSIADTVRHDTTVESALQSLRDVEGNQTIPETGAITSGMTKIFLDQDMCKTAVTKGVNPTLLQH